MLSQDPPPVILSVYFKYWVFVLICLGLSVIGRIVVGDILDALMLVVIWLQAYYMTRANCKGMDQRCLMSLGLICFIRLIFELVSLVLCLVNGRTTESVSNLFSRSIDYSPASFQVRTIQQHSFFDLSLSWQYNLEAVMMIYTPTVVALTILLSYKSYKEFPDLFAEDEQAEAGFAPFQAQYGGVGQGNTPQSRAPAEAGRSAVPFSGQGQRLGS